jgi:hypothetical protein
MQPKARNGLKWFKQMAFDEFDKFDEFGKVVVFGVFAC